MKFACATSACAVVLTALVAAQAEKVTIGVTPKPGQIIHYVATQEINVDLVPDSAKDAAGNAVPSLVPPMKIVSKTMLTYTMVTNAANEQGRITSQVTYDQATAEMSINGTPFPSPATLGALVGKTYTIVFGADGSVIDVTAPDAKDETLAPVKAFIAEMSKYYPTASLAVGESTTRPLTLALPIPIPGAGPMNLDGQMKMTLVSLAADGTDRIANCDQSFDAATKRPEATAASPAPVPPLDISMRGTAKLQLNLDRGVVKNSQIDTTVDGAFPAPVGGPDAPKLKLRGVMKATVTGTY